MDKRNASLGRRQAVQEGGLLIRTACEAAGTPGRGLLIPRVGGTGGVLIRLWGYCFPLHALLPSIICAPALSALKRPMPITLDSLFAFIPFSHDLVRAIMGFFSGPRGPDSSFGRRLSDPLGLGRLLWANFKQNQTS